MYSLTKTVRVNIHKCVCVSNIFIYWLSRGKCSIVWVHLEEVDLCGAIDNGAGQ